MFYFSFPTCCYPCPSPSSFLLTPKQILDKQVNAHITNENHSATFVKMRNHFTRDGRDAHLGRYAFGFSWGSWAALAISTVLFLLAMLQRDKNRYNNHRSTYATDGHDRVVADGPATTGTGGRRGFFGGWGRRSNSGKSYDGRRVKDDY